VGTGPARAGHYGYSFRWVLLTTFDELAARGWHRDFGVRPRHQESRGGSHGVGIREALPPRVGTRGPRGRGPGGTDGPASIEALPSRQVEGLLTGQACRPGEVSLRRPGHRLGSSSYRQSDPPRRRPGPTPRRRDGRSLQQLLGTLEHALGDKVPRSSFWGDADEGQSPVRGRRSAWNAMSFFFFFFFPGSKAPARPEWAGGDLLQPENSGRGGARRSNSLEGCTHARVPNWRCGTHLRTANGAPARPRRRDGQSLHRPACSALGQSSSVRPGRTTAQTVVERSSLPGPISRFQDTGVLRTRSNTGDWTCRRRSSDISGDGGALRISCPRGTLTETAKRTNWLGARGHQDRKEPSFAEAGRVPPAGAAPPQIARPSRLSRRLACRKRVGAEPIRGLGWIDTARKGASLSNASSKCDGPFCRLGGTSWGPACLGHPPAAAKTSLGPPTAPDKHGSGGSLRPSLPPGFTGG